MNDKYILKGKTPKKIDDLIEWAILFGTQNRTVEKTKIGDVNISTIFLGLDHSFSGGKPMLFETMISGGDNNDCQERYSTWDEAVTGHELACEKVRNCKK